MFFCLFVLTDLYSLSLEIKCISYNHNGHFIKRVALPKLVFSYFKQSPYWSLATSVSMPGPVLAG